MADIKTDYSVVTLCGSTRFKKELVVFLTKWV